uniref:Uncharacterized protein n=1 Tax=Arundo donax TaxID=35708 RepID=A0A0A9F164_ARUDO
MTQHTGKFNTRPPDKIIKALCVFTQSGLFFMQGLERSQTYIDKHIILKIWSRYLQHLYITHNII